MTTESLDKPKFGYDYYLKMASSFASEGKYEEAKEIVQLMISKWPERVMSKRNKITVPVKDQVDH